MGMQLHLGLKLGNGQIACMVGNRDAQPKLSKRTTESCFIELAYIALDSRNDPRVSLALTHRPDTQYSQK